MRVDAKLLGTRAAHSRTRVLTVLGVAVVVASAPLLLAIDEPWVIAWSDLCLLLIVVAAALKCCATTRRLRDHERTAWIFISLAYVSYALAHLAWTTYELILDAPNPIPAPHDVGYMIAPLLMIIGIWLYRSSPPTLSTALVQIGNTAILVAAIYLANTILFQHRLEQLNSPILSRTLIGYVVIAMAAFVFALFNISFYLRGRRRLVMMPLLLALGTLAVSDYRSAYEFAYGLYTSGSYGNIGYFFTFAFGYWAAFEQEHLGDAPVSGRVAHSAYESARQWETLLPVFAVFGLIVVALAHAENLTSDLRPHATAALVVFVAGLGLRNWWSQSVENQLREDAKRGAALLRESERRLISKNQELAAANRRLSKEIAARKHVQDELRHSQKMEAVGQLTGGVAHDFNNLLAVIVGNVDLLEQTLDPDSPQRVYTQEATAAVNRGAALTERLLAFSRKQALDPRPVCVNALLKSMTELLERTLGETIQLRFELSASVAACMVDRAQLENAILNLAINARDAMPKGGLISIATSNVTLSGREFAEIPVGASGEFVSISVRDTGIGMSSDVCSRAFEPFFTTKDVGSGSGLGLSMVYGFAKQSDGHIAIESNVGAGTEVRIYIPRTDLRADSPEERDRESVPSGRRESVLVVEDDHALRKVIVAFLREQNYQVAAAEDGPDALAILEESGPFDLLLSDIILPGELLGPALANEVTRRQPSMKVLLMSGYAADAIEGKTSPGDRSNLLQKPFDMATLARKMRSVLKGAREAESDSD